MVDLVFNNFSLTALVVNSFYLGYLLSIVFSS